MEPEAKLETAVLAVVEPIKPAPKVPPPIQELTPIPTPADNAPAAAPVGGEIHNAANKRPDQQMCPLPIRISVFQRVVHAVGIPVEVLGAARVLHVVVHREEGAGDGVIDTSVHVDEPVTH